MAKKSVKRSAPKAKRHHYKAETYGIRLDSLTFLVFAVFVLFVAMWLVSKMMGFRLF